MAIEAGKGSRRQWLLLGGLLVALAVVLFAQSRGGAPPANQPGRTSNPQAGGRSRGAAAGDPSELDVRLDALTAGRPAPESIQRNPFQFEARRRPEPEGEVDEGPGGRMPPPGPVEPAMPPAPPPPPPIPLKFIGIIESAGVGKMAALSDGRRVFHGRTGDIIEGRYRIVRIGAESIVLESLENGTQQTIRLSGQ